MQSSHTDFGQAGYPQQYPYPPGQLSQTNELNKQVQVAQQQQQPMYSQAGPPTPQQQGGPGGPQQMSRTAHVSAMQNFYVRGAGVPRTLPGMGRTSLTSVVNQGQPQGAQQPQGGSGAQTPYSHAVQMVPSHSFHPMQPILVNTHHQLPMAYQQRAYSAQQFSVINTGQPFLVNNWNNYNNPPPPNSNGYYPQHTALSSFQPLPPQLPPQPVAPSQQQPPPAQSQKKVIPIIDPHTGKNIMEDGVQVAKEVPPRIQTDKETENADPNICIQFATQVAAVLAVDDKSEPPPKPVAEVRILAEPQPVMEAECVEEIAHDAYRDVRNNPENLAYYSKQNEESPCEVVEEESKPVVEDLQPPDVEEEEVPVDVEDPELGETPPNDQTVPDLNVGFCNVEELNKVNAQFIADEVEPTVEVAQPMPAPIQTEAIQPATEEATPATHLKTEDKQKTAESKKNKPKNKKKELNKKGESKEGGEMDAFLLDNKSSEEEQPPVLEQPPSPIVDSEVLESIPLPGEEPPQEDADKENDPASKMVLKYSYKEDQWSPLNPEGKKQYDRDFLLQLQSQPMSLCKPTNLPNLDVIKDKAHIQRLTEVNRTTPIMSVRTYNDPFMPNYARGGTARPPHTPMGRRSQTGGGRGGGEGKPKKVISFSSSLNQTIKLHESENAWKPGYKQETSPEETEETQELYRRVRGILNKLTPQKFECLVKQVKNLDIKTEEKLNCVIDLIFEKAIDEPNFSVPYASMCKELALIQVPLAGQPGQFVRFRKLLLTKCQKQFEQDTTEELRREDRMRAIEQAEGDKRKELQLEYNEEEKKMRYRQLGNIRFIGELFKLEMLTEPIMHECIHKLLKQGDEESLECLCRLLKTIGKELDEGKNSQGNQMDYYFAQMQRIVDKRLTSSRVRFMLQDVIDLKKNHWVPRRDESNPKTIDQIHKDAEREAREQQQSYQNMSSSSQGGGGSGSSYGKRMAADERRKGAGRNMGVSEDGWTSSTKSNKGSYQSVDPMKLKLTKPDEVESIRLGPGGRGLQSWGRGSSGGNKTNSPAPPQEEKALTTNRYSALADQTLTMSSFEGRRGSQRSAASSRESSRGGGPMRKTPSTSKERESLLATVKGLSRGQEARKTPEPAVPKSTATAQVNGKAPPNLSALELRGEDINLEDMERKTKPLIDEFLHNADYEEAVKCVMELCSPSTVHVFVECSVNQVLERSSQARALLGQLLCTLMRKKVLTTQQYKKGLSRVLEEVDDYSLDIPMIWEYIGEILEPLLEEGFSLSFLREVLEPCLPSATAGRLVAATLHAATKKKGTLKLGELWRESGLQWSEFLGQDIDVQEFIKMHKLEFTQSTVKVAPPQQDLSPEHLRKELDRLLQKDEPNEHIFDWIDANVSPQALTEPPFIRALVTAVHRSAITGCGGKCELDAAKLKKRVPLLMRYIDQMELQALYAIQALMNELDQPKGILHQIFDLLYDDDVIPDEVFKRWEQSEDPNEMEGKGVAVLSVTPFFTWLREAESGDSAEEEP